MHNTRPNRYRKYVYYSRMVLDVETLVRRECQYAAHSIIGRQTRSYRFRSEGSYCIFGVSLSSQRTTSDMYDEKAIQVVAMFGRVEMNKTTTTKSFRRVPVALNNWCVAREARAGGVHKKRMEKRKQKQFTLKSAAGTLHWDSFKVATALEQCRCRCHCRCYLVSMTISPTPANIWNNNCFGLFSFVCSSRTLFLAHFFAPDSNEPLLFFLRLFARPSTRPVCTIFYFFPSFSLSSWAWHSDLWRVWHSVRWRGSVWMFVVRQIAFTYSIRQILFLWDNTWSTIHHKMTTCSSHP